VAETAGTATFTVTLSPLSYQAVSVQYATANNSPVSAAAGSDYTAKSGTLDFAAGTATQTFTVNISDDLLDEANETFLVNLSNATNATIGDGQGVGTITDNDATPSLSINNVSQSEGVASMVFTITLSAISGQNVTVLYATANNSPVSATAGSDYTATSGTATINAGSTTATFSVPITNDTTAESDETFLVNLSSPTNATLSVSQGVGTIQDNDTTSYQLRVNDVTVSEAAGTATITLTLTAARPASFNVVYSTANGTTNPATAGSDYTGATNVTVPFPSGATTKTFTVPILQDTADEPDETFFVNLISDTDSSVTIADSQGIVTITDDDPTPSMSINSATSITEGNTGTTNGTFTVSLSASTYQTVTVNYSTTGGTAGAGDYNSITSTQLTIPAGSTSGTITVTVIGDYLYEANETFTVNLTGATNISSVTNATGTATITNDDVAPSIVFADQSFNESVGNAAVAVTLSTASGLDATVSYATTSTGYTASAGTDYTSTSGTITFLAGQTSPATPITVAISNDTTAESNETFGVTLSSPVNATLSPSPQTRTMTIVDDDVAVQFKVNVYYLSWGQNQIPAYMHIVNNSSTSVQWRDFKIRYYYTNDGATVTPTCNGNPWYACQNITWGSGTTHGVTYLEMNFVNTDSTRYVNANSTSDEIQLILSGSGPLTSSNDYSYVSNASTPTDAPKITLWRKNAQGGYDLVWGTEP
jgi:hypothetical protein